MDESKHQKSRRVVGTSWLISSGSGCHHSALQLSQKAIWQEIVGLTSQRRCQDEKFYANSSGIFILISGMQQQLRSIASTPSIQKRRVLVFMGYFGSVQGDRAAFREFPTVSKHPSPLAKWRSCSRQPSRLKRKSVFQSSWLMCREFASSPFFEYVQLQQLSIQNAPKADCPLSAQNRSWPDGGSFSRFHSVDSEKYTVFGARSPADGRPRIIWQPRQTPIQPAMRASANRS